MSASACSAAGRSLRQREVADRLAQHLLLVGRGQIEQVGARRPGLARGPGQLLGGGERAPGARGGAHRGLGGAVQQALGRLRGGRAGRRGLRRRGGSAPAARPPCRARRGSAGWPSVDRYHGRCDVDRCNADRCSIDRCRSPLLRAFLRRARHAQRASDARADRRGRAPPGRRDRARAAAGGDGGRPRPRRRGRAGQGARRPLRRARARSRPARRPRRRCLPRGARRAAGDRDPDADRGRRARGPGRGPVARRRRLPRQAVPVRRAGGADPRAGAARRRRAARRCSSHGDIELDPARRRLTRGGRRGRAGPQGVRRARGADGRRRRDGLRRGAARAGVGRAHRPVHQRGADDDHDAAPQARRARRWSRR